MKSCLWCLLGLFFCSCVSDARGDLFTIDVSGDRYIKKRHSDGFLEVISATTGLNNITDGLVVGEVTSSAPTAFGTGAAVLPFPLPLIPAGHSIISANLSFSANQFNTKIAPSVDLYGLGLGFVPGFDIRMNDTVLVTDYYDSGTPDPLDAILIQDEILKSNLLGLNTGSSFSSHETDSAADSALVGYLNTLFTNGAVAGNFAFLRFNVDGGQAGDPKFFRIGSSAGNEGAVLTVITAVPEPSAFLFGTMACAVFGMRFTRRRRR